ncbi:hypothetical protein PpBr36_05463 [Pyricularia pennisetigena]|uniref:hypothetical protein n=1 Tax=Pyricularia pennisetigena TaxID=1578925 RepID=UPI0011536573|nr:hypothetical protein PpBr36_05463 [Pyricularia pennisetigena]TLS27449.1 hypothetical protein PpBr36_05463 [Pyricularia pennisetigena]
MQVSFLTLLALATATDATLFKLPNFANANSYGSSGAVNTNGLSGCQAACVSSAMPQLGGGYAMGATPVSTFCSSPGLQSWFTAKVSPCQKTCTRSEPQSGAVYRRTFGLLGLGGFGGFGVSGGVNAGMGWLKQTCPSGSSAPGSATQDEGYGNSSPGSATQDEGYGNSSPGPAAQDQGYGNSSPTPGSGNSSPTPQTPGSGDSSPTPQTPDSGNSSPTPQTPGSGSGTVPPAPQDTDHENDEPTSSAAPEPDTCGGPVPASSVLPAAASPTPTQDDSAY